MGLFGRNAVDELRVVPEDLAPAAVPPQIVEALPDPGAVAAGLVGRFAGGQAASEAADLISRHRQAYGRVALEDLNAVRGGPLAVLGIVILTEPFAVSVWASWDLSRRNRRLLSRRIEARCRQQGAAAAAMLALQMRVDGQLRMVTLASSLADGYRDCADTYRDIALEKYLKHPW